MHDSDYIRIYRNEINDPLFEDKDLFRWWLWLRLSAANRRRVQIVGKTRIRVKVNFGEYATTVKSLSKKWEMDNRTVDDFLNHLVEDGRIRLRREGQVTIITIVNYHLYAKPEIELTNEAACTDESVAFSTEAQQIYSKLKSELECVLNNRISMVVSDETRNEMRCMMQEELQRLMQSRMQTSLQSHMSHSMQKTMSESVPADITSSTKGEEDKNLNINSASTSRERELEFYENLRGIDDEAMASIANTLQLSDKEAVLVWMKKYWDFILSSGRFHKSQQDFNTNFLSWYRKINIKQEGKKSYGRKEEKQESRRGRAESRRGSEGSAQSPDDYDAPFPTE